MPAVAPKFSMQDMIMMQELDLKRKQAAADAAPVELPAITGDVPLTRPSLVDRVVKTFEAQGKPVPPGLVESFGRLQQGGFGIEKGQTLVPGETVSGKLAEKRGMEMRDRALDIQEARRKEAITEQHRAEDRNKPKAPITLNTAQNKMQVAVIASGDGPEAKQAQDALQKMTKEDLSTTLVDLAVDAAKGDPIAIRALKFLVSSKQSPVDRLMEGALAGGGEQDLSKMSIDALLSALSNKLETAK